MPVEVVRHQLHERGELSLHRLQQAEIQRAVLDDVDQIRIHIAFQTVDHVIEHAVHILEPGRHDGEIGPAVGKHAAEHLREHDAERQAHALGALGQLQLQHGFVFVAALQDLPGGVAREVHQMGGAQIVVGAHLQIGVRLHGEIPAQHGQPDVVDAAGSHDRVRRCGKEAVAPHLTVIFPAVVQVGGTAQDHAELRGDVFCLIVFSVVGHKLPRQQRLRGVAEQLRVDALPVALLVLDEVVGGFERVGKIRLERRGRDLVGVVGVNVLDGIVVAKQIADGQHAVVRVGVEMEQICQRPENVVGFHAGDPQLIGDLVLGHRPERHGQNELHERVALRFGVGRHKRRHRVGVGHEHGAVAAHVIPEQIALGKHVDENLAGCAGEIHVQRAEQIAELVLHDDEALPLGRGAPQIGDELQLFIKRLLLHGKIHPAADRVIMLAGDPPDIANGRLCLAEPGHLGDLVFDGDGGQLHAGAEILRLLVKQALAAVIAVRVPAHAGVGVAGDRRGRNLDHLRVQHMGERIHQPVDPAVTHAVDRIAAAGGDLACDQRESELPGVDDQRRLQHDHKIGLPEKRLVFLHHLQIIQLTEREDADLAVCFPVAEIVHGPKGLHAGIARDGFPEPLRDVRLR